MCIPRASVIIPAFNSEKYIRTSLRSAQNQTMKNLEIIVIDDGSTDRTPELVDAASALDTRIKLLKLPHNRGPSVARNAGLERAAGDWIVMLDSDDRMAAGRIQRLIEAAEIDELDVACDSMMIIHGENSRKPKLLTHDSAKISVDIKLEDYLSGNMLGFRNSSLEFLQPIFRRDTLHALSLKYNEKLFIAEDFDFVARLLACGCRMKIYPWVAYFYIKREYSLSHRWSGEALEEILRANDALRRYPSCKEPKIARILDKRAGNIMREIAFLNLASYLKQHKYWQAAVAAATSPASVIMLHRVLRSRMAGVFPKR